MRSLALKLTLAFLLVSFTVTVLGVVFARQSTIREFNQLVINRAQDALIKQVMNHYAAYGNIQNIASISNSQTRFPHRRDNKQQPTMGQFPVEPPWLHTTLFALVDKEGIVVLPTGPYHLGDQLSKSEISQGTKIEIDGEIIGSVLIAGRLPTLDIRDEQYLQRINQALFNAALVSMVIALLMAIFFAHTLSHPLRELTTAIRAMAKGEIQQKVPVRSKDELGELAESFNQMSSDLARSNQVRRQMTADIAHDLRTPLTVIGGYIEALRDGVLKPSPQRFETIYNEVGLLHRLIQDLRTLSLADAGELSLNRQKVDPRDLLLRIKSTYQHACVNKGIYLESYNQEDLPDVYVDEERMAQVLGNLVTNAIHYTHEGGRITLASSSSSEGIHLSVKDSGEGIPSESLPNIFNRFYRADNARSDENGESGLGLAIARSIVLAHGGDIKVTSEVGIGSEFIITLPVV